MIDIDYYNANRGIRSPLHEFNGKVYGLWLEGNYYRSNTPTDGVVKRFYGKYPPSYMTKMKLLFHDEFANGMVLHLFSGTVKAQSTHEITVDLNPDLQPDRVGNAEEIDTLFHVPLEFDLILADPPYGDNHVKYGTPKVNKKKVVQACSRIVKPGGYLVWLDTIMPMWAKKDGWKLRGTIGLNQSTNHAVRMVTILEKCEDVNEHQC